MERLAYRIDESARIIGIGRTKLLTEISEGRLKTFRIGRRVLIGADELERYVNDLMRDVV